LIRGEGGWQGWMMKAVPYDAAGESGSRLRSCRAVIRS